MPNFYKENRCYFCPKVFCCRECRGKHESSVHKTEIICYICAKFSKPPIPARYKPFTMNTKPLICVEKDGKVSDQSGECSPRTPPLEIRKFDQLKKNISSATTTPYPPNEKEKKCVSFDTSINQEGCKQFSMQIGATSTPYQMNIVKESDISNESNYPQQEKDGEKEIKKEENGFESTLAEDVSKPLEYSNSKLDDYPGTQSYADNDGLEISELNTISIESKSLKVSDTSNSKSNNSSSFAISGKDTIPEEQDDNILNEEPDPNGATDTLLWESACSFTDYTTKQSDEEETCTSEYLQVFKSACSETAEAPSVDNDGTETEFNRSSFVDLSQGVWKTITDSIRSALDSTREICSITGTISKRSLDLADHNEPTAKRRKYEPYLKCRPPIHDLGIIVFSRFNSKTSLSHDKATQTEDCYFT